MWTEQQVDILRTLWGTVKTSEIAEQLGRSYDSVYNKAKSLGLGKFATIKSPKRRQRQAPQVSLPSVPFEPEFTNPDLPPHPYWAIGPHNCRWPLGHPGDPEFKFCGELVRNVGAPYCHEHTERAYHRMGRKLEDA